MMKLESKSFRQIANDSVIFDSLKLVDSKDEISSNLTDREIHCPVSKFRFNCKFCPDAGYNDAEEFREHHKSQWHSYNLSAKLKKKPLLSANDYEEFQSVLNVSEGDSDDWDESDEETIDSDDEDADGIRVDSQVKFLLKDQSYTLQRTLLFDSKQEYKSGKVTLPMIKHFIHKAATSKWAFFLIRSGRVYAAMFDLGKSEGELVLQKSFKRYTERRKQGGSQMLRDKSGKVANSAGSQLRRANEQALLKDVEKLLGEWSNDLKKCQFLFWNRNFFSQIALFQNEKILLKSDPRLRTIPFSINKPCVEEAIRSFRLLSHAYKERS